MRGAAFALLLLALLSGRGVLPEEAAVLLSVASAIRAGLRLGSGEWADLSAGERLGVILEVVL